MSPSRSNRARCSPRSSWRPRSRRKFADKERKAGVVCLRAVSVAAAQRRGFTRLLDKLETGDVLVVTKLDRLGRNAMDVGSTVAKLTEIGVQVRCLALGGVDLASSTGKLTMNVINAVAEFERDLLIERTQAGLNRAKTEGKTLGRPSTLTDHQRNQVTRRLEEGAGVSALAREFKVSRHARSVSHLAPVV